MGKSFISGIRKLMDKSKDKEQAYIRQVVALFLEAYAKSLERKQGRESIKAGVMSSKIRDELKGQFKNLGYTSDLASIEVYMKKHIEDMWEEMDGMLVGAIYQSITSSAYKKKTGQVYTPQYIIDYMVKRSVTESRVVENPYIRILDPSCGSGYFLVAIYRKLLSIFMANRERIITKNPELLGEYQKGISDFIVKNCIYGVDKDSFSSSLSRIALAIESGTFSENIECGDMLLDQYDRFMDIVIGNPPYIGIKNLDRDYKKSLREAYPHVYEDKSDISYCFFQKANEILSDGGELNIISSRYMMEAHYAKGLRAYIDREYDIESILDFYGENVFKGISVSPAIFKFKKLPPSSSFSYGRVKRQKDSGQFEDLNELEVFEIDRSRLKSDSWVMEPDFIYSLYNRIDNMGDRALSEIVMFNQGIITGCDKAFVIDSENKIPKDERDCLKPWIKNSGVKRYEIDPPSKFLINLERGELENYPAIGLHLEKHIPQLKARRECKLGTKHWYELQWGRDKSKFTGRRIVFPYKADKNRFALVEEEIYHSADVYSLKIIDEHRSIISEEYLLAYLNSSLFEFYFKVVAKKVGVSLYEYYPNRLINLNLKLGDGYTVEGLVIEMLHSQKNQSRVEISEKIDEYFFNLYAISDREIEVIREYIKDA